MFEVGRALSSTWRALSAFRPDAPHGTKILKKTKRPRRSFIEPGALDLGDHEPAPETIKLAASHRPRSRGTLRRGAVLCGLSLLVSLAWGATQDDQFRSFARSLMPADEGLAQSIGLGIDQVSLAGHRYTYDGDIFNALDLGNIRSFLSFDAKAAKNRIERLPWIATAELTRVFPGRLDVHVTERRPYALWTRGDTQYLIDETGRVLAAVTGGSLPDLPRIAGEGAAADAKALLDLVARFPEIASRLTEAERIGERRWDLKLKDGVTLRLPVDGEAKVLDEISRDEKLMKLAAGANTTIDFRGPGRAAVRQILTTPGAASPGPGS